MNPTRKIAGSCTPTSDTVGPSAAVRVYAGAMQETPITTAPSSPTDPAFRPFSLRFPRVSCGTAALVLMSLPLKCHSPLNVLAG